MFYVLTLFRHLSLKIYKIVLTQMHPGFLPPRYQAPAARRILSLPRCDPYSSVLYLQICLPTEQDPQSASLLPP